MSGRRLGRAGPDTPLLTRADIPDMPPEIVDPTSVFNPGAILLDGRTLLLLRVQTRGRRTFLVPAALADERAVSIAPRPTSLVGLERVPGTVYHVYDPRLSLLDGSLYAVTALDTSQGGRLAVWAAAGDTARGFHGLDRLELIGTTGDYDTRNGVLFPTRVGGRWLMLERPNREAPTGGPPTGSTVAMLASDDLRRWEPVGPVLTGRPHYWDELIGAGPPPIAVAEGWLLVYHGVATHFGAANVYQAGCVLLDRDDPARVLARCRDNILEPRTPWELAGQVPNVVFPSGLTVTDDDKARIFYGAADTCVGLYETSVRDLVAACAEPEARSHP